MAGAWRVTLINLNQADPPAWIVRHRIALGEGFFPAGRPFFEVQLEAGAGAEFRIYRKDYGSQPMFRFPWQA